MKGRTDAVPTIESPFDTEHNNANSSTRQLITEVNRRFIHWLIDDDASRNFPHVTAILRAAPVGALNALISQCPFLLCGLRFDDAVGWRRLQQSIATVRIIELPQDMDVASLAHASLLVAWHLVKRWPIEGPMLIGANLDVANILGTLSAFSLCQVTLGYHRWLSPRLSTRADLWQQLTRLAAENSSASSALSDRMAELLSAAILTATR